MKKEEANKLWKRLFGFQRNDRVRIVKAYPKFKGEMGTISYVYPRNHQLRYLVKMDKYGSIPCKSEDLEYIGDEEE